MSNVAGIARDPVKIMWPLTTVIDTLLNSHKYSPNIIEIDIWY